MIRLDNVHKAFGSKRVLQGLSLDVARGEGVEIFDRAIDVTISRLRRKLAPDDIITTVRNEGYMMTLAPEPA